MKQKLLEKYGGISMGMIACYQMVEENKLKELFEKNNEELFDEIEELQEEDEAVFDIDKLWDGLHFLLTNATATEPIEGNPLSEAIVGTKNFCEDEDADFIAYIFPERVQAILEALKDFDIERAVEDFQPEKFAKQDIYPNIWVTEMKEQLQEELEESFNGLRSFYEEAEQQGMGVIVSIY